MATLMHYDPENLWQIEQRGFDERYLGKTESIMVLGNGYLCTRSSEEEAYVGKNGTPSWPGPSMPLMKMK